MITSIENIVNSLTKHGYPNFLSRKGTG